MKRENFKTLRKSTHEFLIYLLVINEKHTNSDFTLCQFENLCFENNALKMASAFLKPGLKLFMTSRSISTGIAATLS